MNQSLARRCLRMLAISCAVLLLALMPGTDVRAVQAQANAGGSVTSSESELIAQFRRVEVASVSDALEQITGKRLYMSHRMQPIFSAKFAGFARTVQLKKDEGNKDPEA